jgi:hypothetical protein
VFIDFLVVFFLGERGVLRVILLSSSTSGVPSFEEKRDEVERKGGSVEVCYPEGSRSREGTSGQQQ